MFQAAAQVRAWQYGPRSRMYRSLRFIDGRLVEIRSRPLLNRFFCCTAPSINLADKPLPRANTGLPFALRQDHLLAAALQ